MLISNFPEYQAQAVAAGACVPALAKIKSITPKACEEQA